MEPEDLIQSCIDICEDRKAENILVYDVRGKSTLADFFLICSGNSSAHLRALQNHLGKSLKEQDIQPKSIEGTPESQWILIDFYDVLIHIFHTDARAHYDIEGIFDSSRIFYPKST